MRIRPATDADAPGVGEVFVRARDEMTYLPRIPDRIRPSMGALILRSADVWVAARRRNVLGFVGIDGDELTHLYVDPSAQRHGLGTELLGHAKGLRPRGLLLWVFLRNTEARKFYERNGFRLCRVTNGAENMEREPDARYSWQPASGRLPTVRQS
ncbi:MAG TPA: GNAT family N-acetyltransferase [Gaiellaceae bacterium]|jgi:GNAT superfamily N-acetyltransferase